jgi:short subunit dehydrogenase-like uncharacterized protein
MADVTDVLLFGPTGVTGREVARHLARRAPELGLTWAVAGRDPDKIERVLAGMPSRPDAVLRADSTDAASIDAMVASTKVVANLVGPYARYGEPVYEACARHGRVELDLTGEVDWVADMIARYHDAAVASGARIVPTAGFEALPFDLGALLAARTAHERSGAPVTEVDVAVTVTNDARVSKASDAVSGGTFVSGVEALRRGSARAFTDPHLLDPDGGSDPRPYDLRPRRHAGTGAWLAPMVPSPFLNPPTVHRGAAQLRSDGDTVYGDDFRYREGIVTRDYVPGPLAAASAAAMSVSQIGFGLSARAPGPIRRPFADLLLRFGPKPGDGPPADQLDAWSYRLEIRATAADGTTADVRVDAEGHPGYKSTATMVGEAALILADDGAPVPSRAGFLTPASALGSEVLDRFIHAGARFTVVG